MIRGKGKRCDGRVDGGEDWVFGFRVIGSLLFFAAAGGVRCKWGEKEKKKRGSRVSSKDRDDLRRKKEKKKRHTSLFPAFCV